MAMLNNQMVYQLVSEFWVSLKMGTPERQKVSSFGAISQLVRFSSHRWIRWRPFFLNFTWVFETLLYVFLGFPDFPRCFPGLFPSRRRSQAFCMFHGAWFSAQWGELILGSLDQRGITEGEFASMQPVTDGWELIYWFWYESAQKNW